MNVHEASEAQEVLRGLVHYSIMEQCPHCGWHVVAHVRLTTSTMSRVRFRIFTTFHSAINFVESIKESDSNERR